MIRNCKLFSAAIPLGLLLLLGACASIPDAANPVYWYRSTADYFSGDDSEAEKKKKQEAERQKQRQARAPAQTPAQTPAQAQAPAQAAAQQPTRESETSEVAERLTRPAGRGLLGDTGGGQPRYAAAIPRQTEDPGAPASRAAAAAGATTTEPPPTPAPRATVSAAAPPAPRSTAAPPPRPQAQAPSAQPPQATAAPSPRPPAPSAQPPTPSAAAPLAPPARPDRGASVDARGDSPARAASVEETYRASLARQNQLPSAGGAGLADDPGTLIISSEGIEAPRSRSPSPGATSAAQPSSQAAASGEGRNLLVAALRPAGSVAELAAARTTKVATIQFADGSARLDEEAREIIGQVAKLQGEKGGMLRVIGHTSMRAKPMDPDRRARVNEGISIARANAVAGQLARLGVKRDAIVVGARGDGEPAYYEVMGTGEAGNRRVEIYLDP
ncbi:MAG: OmpA family protein [Rhodospirillales bacterium]|nr:OmpA family protein [Rhodospirillales bacterium]MSP80863.1 OmpA family protein [Rhodospirillales bacterium]